MRGSLLILTGILGSCAFGGMHAAEPIDYARQIKPLLETKCLRCHGERRRGGQLDMRTVDAMLKGGASGPAFQPGKAAKSLMIELIHFKEMPPKKEQPKVTPEELELLKSWIDGMSP